ncbi:MAG: peptidyl-prolyl cis-trans isomerase [Flavobacteriales bacterium]|nr:peptidyl-prolyl cis-trans isomerase [Flavobacteriales bacterium]
MTKLNHYILLSFLILMVSSCQLFEKNKEQKAIARVNDKYLYPDELVGIIPQKSTPEDSVTIANNYIQKWIKENLMLAKAELNLKESQKDFKKQLDDYRNTLIIYTYQEEMISQRLDTLVLAQEIKEYYDNNKHNFNLKDDIVKVRYIKVSKNAPQLKKIKKLYRSTKEEDQKKLSDYVHQFAEKFHLNEDEWILFDEVLKEVPLQVSNKRDYLKNIKNVETEDSLSYYFVHIKDYKLESDVAPLTFERYNIKNIILNKRKLELINAIKKDLYQEAILKKEFEIYEESTQ